MMNQPVKTIVWEVRRGQVMAYICAASKSEALSVAQSMPMFQAVEGFFVVKQKKYK